jgi:hypothetical protein
LEHLGGEIFIQELDTLRIGLELKIEFKSVEF